MAQFVCLLNPSFLNYIKGYMLPHIVLWLSHNVMWGSHLPFWLGQYFDMTACGPSLQMLSLIRQNSNNMVVDLRK